MSHLEYQNCIAACIDCAIESRRCASACLDEDNIKMLSHCVRLDHGSAAICLLAIDAMTGGSEFVKQICNRVQQDQ